MAWRKEPNPPPPSSTIRQLLPLLVTLVLLGVLGWVCYLVYQSVSRIQAQARKQMMGDGGGVVFSRDGVRVNVQDVGNESYLDATQSWVVKAWHLGTSSGGGNDDGKGKRKRHGHARHGPSDSS